MNRLKIGVLLFIGIGFLALGISVFRERIFLSKSVEELRNSDRKIAEENKTLNEKIKYFTVPENLVKESKTQFNYISPGEKLIILVSSSSPISSSTKQKEN